MDAKSFLAHMPTTPGVYQMRDAHQILLYVGKAKHLKNRLSSYFQKNLVPKTQKLMSQVEDIQVTVTRTEKEALILENQLIKQHKPKYNILFRDDKSYPFILISEHAFPRLDFYRGKNQPLKGRYFGPYPSTLAVKETMKLIQKVFQLRTCKDLDFANRSRPCLQYQIGCCKAPCVNYISEKDYAADVTATAQLLQGKSEAVISQLQTQMQAAAKTHAYEKAARYRDQIAAIRHLQSKQVVHQNRALNADVIVALEAQGVFCVQLLMMREGSLLGSRSFFPEVPEAASTEDVVQAFITQHYLQEGISFPKLIVADAELSEILPVLSQEAGMKIEHSRGQRGELAKCRAMAEESAKTQLDRELAQTLRYQEKWQALLKHLDLPNIHRMECFDISHHRGDHTVASCVIFNEAGPQPSAYRQFLIRDAKASDDYAAMREVLHRRYQKLLQDQASLPDLLIVDGGKGQITQAKIVLEKLGITSLPILGIAKGPTRKPGLETLWWEKQANPLDLPADDPALHLLQHIRDEAHRFAITQHRQKKNQTQTWLLDIPGIGAKRKQALLKHFGGIPALKQATVEELAQVPGLSPALATLVYQYLRA